MNGEAMKSEVLKRQVFNDASRCTQCSVLLQAHAGVCRVSTIECFRLSGRRQLNENR